MHDTLDPNLYPDPTDHAPPLSVKSAAQSGDSSPRDDQPSRWGDYRNLRLGRALISALGALAHSDTRSMTQEVQHILRSYVANRLSDLPRDIRQALLTEWGVEDGNG